MSKYAKAIVAAIVAGLGTFQLAAADGTLTPVEWAQVASTVLASFGAVWATTNAPVEPPDISE